MHTASPLTLHLLGAIGLYMVAIGAGALIDPGRWRDLGEEMERSAALTILMGLVTFAIGVALLGVHHGLADPCRSWSPRSARSPRSKGSDPRRAAGDDRVRRPLPGAAARLGDLQVVLGLAFILAGVFVTAGPTL